MINWSAQLSDADLEQFCYQLSDPAKEVPLMDFDNSTKATKAINHFFEKKLYGDVTEEVN